MNLANLAKEYDVKHFLYSSVIGADLNTGIPHWESKFKIENHIKQINLPYTIIRPASLFENFLIPQVKSRIVKGKTGFSGKQRCYTTIYQFKRYWRNKCRYIHEPG